MTELSVDIDGGGPDRPAPSDPAWRRISLAALALAVAFAVGAAVGYQVRAEMPVPPQSIPVGNASVVATGEQCATQIGTTLWLGVEVINHGPGPVVLKSIGFTTPLNGLVEQAGMWAPCGEIRAALATDPQELADGAKMWVSGTFEVQVDCPMPLPVQFSLTYTDTTAATHQDLIGGFPDLGRVPYSGCNV
jgi:hypothetical protein